MKNNNKGFSLILAMGLVVIISLLAMSILEYIIPFSKNIKGVENSSQAYYSANSGIEEGLYSVYKRNGSGTIDNITEYSKVLPTSKKGYGYDTLSSGNILPSFGKGNSEYDSNWNIISQGNSLQLEIGNGKIDFGVGDQLKIAFRVPDVNGPIISDKQTLTGSLFGSNYPIINWQLSSDTKTLNASGSIIIAEKVCESNQINCYTNNGIDLKNLSGVDLDGLPLTINAFYTNNCMTGFKCNLKFSVVNKLELNIDNISLPYLEWQLGTTNAVIPLRYTNIKSYGKSIGYKRELEVKVESRTLNEAFDFTIFQ